MAEQRGGGDRAPDVVVDPVLRTGAGTPVTVPLLVTNRSAGSRVLTVTAHGIDPTWVTAPPPGPPVLPGATVTVPLVLTPAVGTVPARYPLAVAVQAVDPAAGPAGAPTTVSDLTLVVDAPGDISLTLTPADSTAVLARTVRIDVRNAGAVAAAVELEMRTSASLAARLAAPRVTVPPGQTVSVRGRLRPRPIRLFGPRHRHSYSVTAHSSAAPRHAEGSLTARAVLGPSTTRIVVLAAVVALWVALAATFVPRIADHFAAHSTSTAHAGPGQSAGGSSGGAGDGGGGSGGGSGGGGPGGGGGSGGGGGPDAGGTPKPDPHRAVLTGTISGAAPGGVKVTIAPADLVAASDLGTTRIGVSPATFTGKFTSDALPVALPSAPRLPTVDSEADGTWRLAGIPKPGLYTVTFTKLGYQTRRFLIDASSADATKPLPVAMVPGQGRLSGVVTGPHGPLGGAQVTITDGGNTITTTTNSRGRIGEWAVDGLATPATYFVSASSDGFSTESTLVDLSARAEAAVTLRLRRGAVSVTGTVRGADPGNRAVLLGGAQVTVSDGRLVRTATAVTKDEAAGRGGAAPNAGDTEGWYTLPHLPPGRYTITASAPGYQPLTGTVTLRYGQSKVTFSPTLESATAAIGGTVRKPGGEPAVGAGLVLTNAVNTYKTTTTSDPPGGYQFAGVEPGTYVLSIQLFGYAPQTVTVTAVAGAPPVTVDVRLVAVPGGGLAPTGAVQGQVVDARTGGPLTCDTSLFDCAHLDFKATATVDDQDQHASFTTRFAASDPYRLPDPNQHNASTGLLPGLHTVTVSAPGYEDAQVKVAVSLGGLATAPTATLQPAPRIVGHVTSKYPPAAPTCVWAVSTTGPDVSGSLPACGAGGADAGCPAASTWPAAAYCANTVTSDDAVAATGSYTIALPRHGGYRVYATTADPEFRTAGSGLAAVGPPLAVDVGSARTSDLLLQRFGRADVTVQAPGRGGPLVAVPGVSVELRRGATCDTAQPVSLPDDFTEDLTSDRNGVVHLVGLSGSYWVTAAVTQDGTPLSGCVQVRGTLDGLDTQTLALTKSLTALVGRVVYVRDGADTPIPDASVQIQGIDAYPGGTAEYKPWSMTTDPDGCFGAISTAPPDDSAADCPHIGDREVGHGKPLDRTENVELLSNAVYVSVSGAGFTPVNGVLTTMAVAPAVNDIVVEPLPAAYTGSSANRLSVAPATDQPDWTQAAITVQPAVGGRPTSATVKGSPGDPAQADITFSQPPYPVNRLRPGRYDITVTLPGYAPAATTLDCALGGACTMAAPLVLMRYARLTMTTVDAAGPVDGAVVTLTSDGAVLNTLTAAADDDKVTFPDLVPGRAGDPDPAVLRAAVRAAGHRFSTDDDLNYALSCTNAAGATSTDIPVPAAGDDVQCTATLEPMGVITGQVKGVKALAPATGPTVDLGGAGVEVRQCAATAQDGNGTWYCTAASPQGVELDGTADAATSSTPGSFRLTGTSSVEGVTAGWWSVTASAPGYCDLSATAAGDCPAALPATVGTGADKAAPIGLAVQVVERSDGTFDVTTPVTVPLYQRPAALKIGAVDDAGNPAAGLTLTLSGGSLGAATVGARETSAGHYVFPLEIPGPYTLTARGEGYLTSAQSVPVAVGAGEFPIAVSRGTNDVRGTVSGPRGTQDADVPLPGVTVCVLAAEDDDCAAAVTGVDGRALTTTTGSDGGFHFLSVPDTPGGASFYLHAEGYGYLPYTDTGFRVVHTGPATYTEAVSLTRVTRTVVVTVQASSSADNLQAAGGTQVAELTSVHDAAHPQQPANTDRTGLAATVDDSRPDAFSVTELQVPFGCWSFGYDLDQLPAHFGSLELTAGGGADDTLTCGAGSFAVPGTPPPMEGGQAEPVDVTYTLAEDRLDLTLDATANPPDVVPPVKLTVTDARTGALVVTRTVDASTGATTSFSQTVWVPDAEYTVVAAVTPSSPGWDDDTGTVTVPAAGGGAASVHLALAEKPGGLTVHVAGAAADHKAKVTLTCEDAQTLPADCADGVTKTDSGSGASFDRLAPGHWLVAVTLDGATVTQEVRLVAGEPATISVPSADSTPTAFPTPTPTPPPPAGPP